MLRRPPIFFDTLAEEIWITDIDRPNAPLKAEVEAINGGVIRLRVANTTVRFSLRRVNGNPYFQGSLGSRDFIFDQSKRNGAVQRAADPQQNLLKDQRRGHEAYRKTPGQGRAVFLHW